MDTMWTESEKMAFRVGMKVKDLEDLVADLKQSLWELFDQIDEEDRDAERGQGRAPRRTAEQEAPGDESPRT